MINGVVLKCELWLSSDFSYGIYWETVLSESAVIEPLFHINTDRHAKHTIFSVYDLATFISKFSLGFLAGFTPHLVLNICQFFL